MKSVLLWVGSFLGIVALIYVVWLVFIPMAIGQKVVDRKITEQSQQYVVSQRSALVSLYQGYTQAKDDDQKTAIKGQMCLIEATIPADEVPAYIKGEISCR